MKIRSVGMSRFVNILVLIESLAFRKCSHIVMVFAENKYTLGALKDSSKTEADESCVMMCLYI